MAAKKNATTNDTPYTFSSGWVYDRNTIRTIAQIDEIAAAGATETQYMKWIRREKRWSYFQIEFRMFRVVTTSDALVLGASAKGTVSAADSSGIWEEKIDSSDNGPRRRGDIRDLNVIDGEVYATGMSRQVYQRVGKKAWEHIDAGVVQPRGRIEVSGFNSIDGISADSLYAAGFNGEIWRRQGGRWEQMDTPTNVVLHKIRVIDSKRVFASGQEGVLLEWNGKIWRVVDLGDFSTDIWSLAWFKQHLYLATEEGLFRLDTKYELKGIKTVPDKEKVCRHLHVNDGVLLSTGPKHVWITSDGSKWDDITP